MELKQTDVFRAWESNLRDRRARTIIASRLMRFADGLSGDVKHIGGGISELRIHYGPGYRIYFSKLGELVILLVCGGDKSSQQRDIDLAQRLVKEWREQNG